MSGPTGSLRWVLVAGTGSYELREPELWSAERIGRELARQGYGLIVGGWAGVDHVAARAFTEALAEVAPGVRLRDRLTQVVPHDHSPDFAGGHIVYVERGPLEWLEALRYADAAVLVGGVGGTYETYVFATQERVPVFPLAGTGGDAERAFLEILAKWRQIGPWGVRQANYASILGTAIGGPGDADEAARLLMRLLHDQFAFADGVASGERNGVFFCYAHADRGWLRAVRRHFDGVPASSLTAWDDTLIRPGRCWDDEIMRRLVASRAAVLIVTPSFLRSDYIRRHELPFLLTQRQHGNIEIFWLLAEQPEKAELAATGLPAIQAAHDTARSLAERSPSELNQTLAEVASKVIAHLIQLQP